MSEALIILFTLTLLPLAPSVILFKILPSKAVVAGPFQGLKINLGGAFAGYIVLLVYLANFFSSHLQTLPHENWHVQGKVEFKSDKLPNINDLFCYVRPPALHVEADGTFDFEIPVKVDDFGMPQLPILVFNLPGYRSEPVHLMRPDEKLPYGLTHYRSQYLQSKKRIVFEEPIILRNSNLDPPYRPITASLGGH